MKAAMRFPLPISITATRRLLQCVAAVALLQVALPTLGADLASGEKLAEERCAACHGKDGNTPIDPSYPRLSGQHQDYLLHSLRDYKDEKRKNAIMGAQAKLLSRTDMENVSAYFSQLPGVMNHKR